jgi:hypothetical protein
LCVKAIIVTHTYGAPTHDVDSILALWYRGYAAALAQDVRTLCLRFFILFMVSTLGFVFTVDPTAGAALRSLVTSRPMAWELHWPVDLDSVLRHSFYLVSQRTRPSGRVCRAHAPLRASSHFLLLEADVVATRAKAMTTYCCQMVFWRVS